MKTKAVFFIFCSVAALQVAYAQGGPPPGVEPGPKHDVEGRTYCSVLNWFTLTGIPSTQSETFGAGLVRRKATFQENGYLLSEPVSWLINFATDSGAVVPVNLENAPGAGPIEILYTQTGNQVQLLYDNGDTANLYVSEDGSVIHGSRIRQFLLEATESAPQRQVGQNITWTMVEVEPGDACASDVPGNYPASP